MEQTVVSQWFGSTWWRYGMNIFTILLSFIPGSTGRQSITTNQWYGVLLLAWTQWHLLATFDRCSNVYVINQSLFIFLNDFQ